jgi:putative ABC transport system ATP-binding protein
MGTSKVEVSYMEILRCENLRKIYGEGNAQVNALDDVSFTVEKGEFVSIIGPSGSGKSTLLHILGGVDKPTSGKVYIGGTDIHSLKESQLAIFRRRQIGLVYQFYNLMPVLNVDENIVLPHLLDGRELDEERLDDIVENLGLTDRRKNLPNQLSGGQQQRVSIGRALYTHPAILLADEPTGNLDRKNGEEIIRLLKESNRKHKQTLILITHDESIALQADRMLYLEDGKIVRDEPIRKSGGGADEK